MHSIYIETTIPSSYYDNRPEPEMVARQHWTRQWWDGLRSNYRLCASVAVLDELWKKPHPNQAEKILLLDGILLLEVTREVIEVAEVYIRNYVMPADPVGDALHLAIADYHKIDILLTWNCNNLANENKMEHIRRTNAMMGLFTPAIVTPLNLLGGE
ncbi:MAG: type II toxin-antitoxin system VapC family toxin [bacterium]|nr:type II toxin-antitoxin system VapC family toxin [bacterium]